MVMLSRRTNVVILLGIVIALLVAGPRVWGETVTLTVTCLAALGVAFALEAVSQTKAGRLPRAGRMPPQVSVDGPLKRFDGRTEAPDAEQGYTPTARRVFAVHDRAWKLDRALADARDRARTLSIALGLRLTEE